ncbi:MAG: VanZ family protein [Anaerotignum faecicola]
MRKIYRTQPYADFLFHPIRLLFRRSSGIGRLSEHPRPQPGCHAASRPPCRHPCRFPKCLSKCAAVRSSGAISPSALGFLPIPPPHAPVCPCVTLFIELSQLFTLRATDINDILTNLAGAAIGYF